MSWNRGAAEFTMVNAFTDRPFTGNPAAVYVLSSEADARWMQAVAAEMAVAETAFVVHRDEHSYDLRWFTPTVEEELCGHATLATAHVLWERGMLPVDAEARFATRSGVLRAARAGSWIEIDLPTERAVAAAPPPALVAGLGCAPVAVGRNRLDYLVELADEAHVRALEPRIHDWAGLGVRGVIVTARSASADQDFVSRFFDPREQPPEDPVTGSAHCALGAYWAERLGRPDLVGYQASRRGGVVQVRHRGARTHLLGQAVTVMRGELIC
jgi:predicted PhzF superfamily epimerase YddE/YHI9